MPKKTVAFTTIVFFVVKLQIPARIIKLFSYLLPVSKARQVNALFYF